MSERVGGRGVKLGVSARDLPVACQSIMSTDIPGSFDFIL